MKIKQAGFYRLVLAIGLIGMGMELVCGAPPPPSPAPDASAARLISETTYEINATGTVFPSAFAIAAPGGPKILGVAVPPAGYNQTTIDGGTVLAPLNLDVGGALFVLHAIDPLQPVPFDDIVVAWASVSPQVADGIYDYSGNDLIDHGRTRSDIAYQVGYWMVGLGSTYGETAQAVPATVASSTRAGNSNISTTDSANQGAPLDTVRFVKRVRSHTNNPTNAVFFTTNLMGTYSPNSYPWTDLNVVPAPPFPVVPQGDGPYFLANTWPGEPSAGAHLPTSANPYFFPLPTPPHYSGGKMSIIPVVGQPTQPTSPLPSPILASSVLAPGVIPNGTVGLIQPGNSNGNAYWSEEWQIYNNAGIADGSPSSPIVIFQKYGFDYRTYVTAGNVATSSTFATAGGAVAIPAASTTGSPTGWNPQELDLEMTGLYPSYRVVVLVTQTAPIARTYVGQIYPAYQITPGNKFADEMGGTVPLGPGGVWPGGPNIAFKFDFTKNVGGMIGGLFGGSGTYAVQLYMAAPFAMNGLNQMQALNLEAGASNIGSATWPLGLPTTPNSKNGDGTQPNIAGTPWTWWKVGPEFDFNVTITAGIQGDIITN